MKLIDLFVKIANGEKIPDIIEFHGRIFRKNGKEYNYYCAEEEKILEEFFIFEELNDEVEVIEDIPKKIELDHFKSIEELKEQVDSWIENDEIYWTRWFGLYDLKKLIDMINGE